MVVVQSQIDVGQGLGLHALSGVHHQQRAFAGRQGARNLVVEVHMAGRVDEIEFVFQAVGGQIGNAHGLGLDGNAALPFQIHFVQILLPGLARADHPREFQNAVGQGGFAVVDMGDDAKIADAILCGHGMSCEGCGVRKKRILGENSGKVHAGPASVQGRRIRPGHSRGWSSAMPSRRGQPVPAPLGPGRSRFFHRSGRRRKVHSFRRVRRQPGGAGRARP